MAKLCTMTVPMAIPEKGSKTARWVTQRPEPPSARYRRRAVTPGWQDHVCQGGWRVCWDSGLAAWPALQMQKLTCGGRRPPGSRARWRGVDAWRPRVLTGRPPCLPQVSRTALLVALLGDRSPGCLLSSLFLLNRKAPCLCPHPRPPCRKLTMLTE